MWAPQDLAASCPAGATISNCSPATFLFLRLVATILGQAKGNSSAGSLKQTLHQSVASVSSQFDFVVVGAGSAGCVVANRLSEVPEWKVLLLEAGPEEPEVVSVPGLAPLLQRSSIDWQTMTQPSTTSCTARPQRRCGWVHGRVMGGTSGLNYMIYMRGNPRDYDEWEALGNPGWSWKDVFPYFLKSEDNRNPELVDAHYHSTGGYQSVSLHAHQDSNIFPIIDAFRELGLPEVDPNAQQQIGVSLVQGTVGDGRRVSTNAAFIRPVRHKRKNLIIRTNSEVVRVLIDKQKKAYGVQYTRNKKMYTAYASKEVIVSSGAINSPVVLMRSGVGPFEHLRSRGIPPIQDLPVGQNLQDHTTLDGFIFLFNRTNTLVDDVQRNADLYHYGMTARGPLSTSSLLQISPMLRSRYATDERPDLQYLIDATNVADFYTDPILDAQTNVNPMAYYNGVNVHAINLSPLSRGQILLNDTDPVGGAPLVYPNTFAEELDLLRIVDGIRQAEGLLQTEAFRKLDVTLISNPLPACGMLEFDSDEYWACVVRSYTASMYHPSGSCKMGPRGDPTAVVDAELRVHGVQSLRVMDTSIMPVIVRGNTNAPAIMIGERGADFLKKRWLNEGEKPEGRERRWYEEDMKSRWKFVDYFLGLVKGS